MRSAAVNSYDATNGAYNESQVLAAAEYLDNSQVAARTIVIDGGWYTDADGNAIIDEFGRPAPDPERFPSSRGGLGFGPLVQRLRQFKNYGPIKLGVWMIRGIPRTAVEKNTPVFNSSFRARDAHTLETNCSWSKLAYGVKAPSLAGEAYYRSIHSILAGWGVTFLKMDCLWPSEVTWKRGQSFLPEL